MSRLKCIYTHIRYMDEHIFYTLDPYEKRLFQFMRLLHITLHGIIHNMYESYGKKYFKYFSFKRKR